MSNFSIFSTTDFFIKLAAKVIVLFCVLPVHEYAHARIATKLGDETAKNQGRLTLSPFAHLDLIGSIMIILFGIGYAKPVPVNPNKFKNPKKGMALTALAGPASNLIMAFVLLILLNAFSAFFGSALKSSNELLYDIIFNFFTFAASINIMLAVFNLLPVPPLDGSRIFWAILPDRFYFKIMQYERYIMIGMFILLLTGILSFPIRILSEYVYKCLNAVASFPFKLFN